MDFYKIIIRVLHRLGILEKFNLGFPIKVNSVAATIPIINGLGAGNLDLTEKWMTELIKRLIKIQSGVFVDVGANIGQTLIKLRAVAPEVDYVGFEPNPTCFHYLTKLVERNNYACTRLYPFALSEKPGIVELSYYSDDSTDSSASMIDTFRDSKVYRKSFISCHSFDEINFNDRLAIIKIDVEGAELEVIRGLQNRIVTDRPIIIMEILPTYSSENSNRLNRQKQILAILSEANYQLLRIHKSYSEVKELEKINEIEIHSNLDWCEYLIVPSEHLAQIEDHFDLI